MALSSPTIVRCLAGLLVVILLSGCQLDSGLRLPGGVPPQSEPPLTDSDEG